MKAPVRGLMVGRPRFRAKTPCELAGEEHPVAEKEILALARDAINGTSLEHLRESAPSLKKRSNLKAQLDRKRRYNKPSVLQLKETEEYLRSRSAELARAADLIAECVAITVTSYDERIMRNSN